MRVGVGERWSSPPGAIFFVCQCDGQVAVGFGEGWISSPGTLFLACQCDGQGGEVWIVIDTAKQTHEWNLRRRAFPPTS